MPIDLWKNLNRQVAYMDHPDKILKGNPVMTNHEESASMKVVVGDEPIEVGADKTRFPDAECLIFEPLNNDRFHII